MAQQDVNINNNDTQMIEDIFKEMNDKNLYQRQMDFDVNVPQENPLNPAQPNQVSQMQDNNEQQQLYQQQLYQQQLNNQNQQQLNQQLNYKQSKINELILLLKQICLFAVLFVLLSLPQITDLMNKLPYISSYPKVLTVLVALLGGVVFVFVSRYL